VQYIIFNYMKTPKVYVDNCCFNRPFDTQTEYIVVLETLAKLYIQELILNNKIDLVWSYVLEYENSRNIVKSKREAIAKWKDLSIEFVHKSNEVVEIANDIAQSGIKAFDALHIACAIFSKCDYIITVDKRMAKYKDNRIVVCNPIDFLKTRGLVC
jgi:predicted nucleic acid-binding protein